MRRPWTRLIDAVAAVLRQPVTPPLPRDARRLIDQWDAEDIAEYHQQGGGLALPDVPGIDDDRTI